MLPSDAFIERKRFKAAKKATALVPHNIDDLSSVPVKFSFVVFTSAIAQLGVRSLIVLGKEEKLKNLYHRSTQNPLIVLIMWLYVSHLSSCASQLF